MADFNYTIDDLSDTGALARKTSDNFYRDLPNGAPLKTSYSKSGDVNRTLTQRDLQSVLSGDALYRNPAFAMQISNNNVQSSINRNIRINFLNRFN